MFIVMWTTSQKYYTSTLDYLCKQGADVDDVFLLPQQERVDAGLYEALLNEGAEKLGDALLGFRLGQDIKLSDFGLLGYLVESAANLQQALDDLLAFDMLVADIGKPTFTQNTSQGVLAWQPQQSTCRHVVLRNMTAWLASVRRLLGQEVSPDTLTLALTLSDNERDELKAWFGCEVNDNQDKHALYFPLALLDMPMASHDPSVYQSLKMLSTQQRLRISQYRETGMAVQQYFTQQTSLVNVTVKSAAQALSLTERTLQRRLRAENTHYSSMLDNERKQRAVILLSSHNMGSVSDLLGFSDQSAFNKAFVRWFAMTPSEYKKRG